MIRAALWRVRSAGRPRPQPPGRLRPLLLAAVETSAADGPWTVPQRLIDGGSLGGQAFDRFDSLDASSGGRTARHSLSAVWHRAEGDTTTQLNAYLMRYRLDLWSNFTYALARPDEGDEFLQQDRRTVAGLGWSQGRAQELAGLPARTEWGLQLRHLGPAALTEDNRPRSPGATTAQARMAWDLAALSPALFKRGSELSLDVFNLGNRRANDIQYHYTSRLPGEAAPVDDRHVHSAEPRQARLTLRMAL